MATTIASIRCPLQKYNDFNVELNFEWKVRDLKEHLSAVYPSKPAVDSQRLIFAGQLMKDDAQVTQYLNRVPLSDRAIIHLVCKFDAAPPTQLSSASESLTLRQRRPQQTGSAASLPSTGQSQQVAVATLPPVTSTPSFFGAHPNWAQGAVAQAPYSTYHAHVYMTQYLQYMQQVYGVGANPYLASGFFNQASAATVVANPAPSVPAAPVLANGAVNVEGHQQAAAAAAPAIVLNAQGGGALDDELGRNDWLDWLYTGIRGSLLFLVLFSYSSMERLIFVLIIVAAVFAYRNGWFSRRRPAQHLPAEGAGSAQANQNEAGEEQRNAVPESTPPSTSHDDPSAWHVFWSTCYTFISSFFSSLIPDQPQNVNL